MFAYLLSEQAIMTQKEVTVIEGNLFGRCTAYQIRRKKVNKSSHE